MKKIFLTILMISASALSAQVIIGDAVGTAPANKKQSVLLEFANSNDKGIILPYVRKLPLNPTPGTLVMDSTVPTAAKVKLYDGNDWRVLSGESDMTLSLINQPLTATEGDAKAIIGSDTSSADGGFSFRIRYQGNDPSNRNRYHKYCKTKPRNDGLRKGFQKIFGHI